MDRRTSLENIDQMGFANALDELHQRLLGDIGPADLAHLCKIERWGKICTILGYATAWLKPNLVSAGLISQGILTRWAMITHHVSHRGYDRVPNLPLRFHSKRYARGWRRWLDWFDWMVPEAWAFEHNTLHHYHTGERLDPDLLEDRVHLMRQVRAPLWLKYGIAFFFMSTWKPLYYAPNTLWMIQQRRQRLGREGFREKIAGHLPPIFHGAGLWNPLTAAGWEFWRRSILPYALGRFGLIPLLFLPLGRQIWLNVLMNSLLAELLTNLHSFLIIVPNHSGEDVWRFEGPVSGKDEFYLRQVMGSVNYTGGNDLADFLQGWLNYQIEHHLWPDLPMLKYRQAQPEVEAICRQYGVPYIRQPIGKRIRQMLRLLTGQTRMPICRGGFQTRPYHPVTDTCL